MNSVRISYFPLFFRTMFFGLPGITFWNFLILTMRQLSSAQNVLLNLQRLYVTLPVCHSGENYSKVLLRVKIAAAVWCWMEPCLYICTLTAPIVRLIVQNYILLCSSMDDRVFIPNSKCRSLLIKYAETGWENAALQLFGEDDMTELKQLLSVHSSSVCSLSESWSIPCLCPSKYASLIKTLATASPACALQSI